MFDFKRILHLLLTFLTAIIILFSCEKLEIPKIENEEEAENTDHPENSDSDPNNDNEDYQENEDNNASDNANDNTGHDEDDPYQGWGSLNNQINKGGTLSKPYRAKDLAKGELGEWVIEKDVESMPNCWVEGYIVGYVKGTTMKSAILFEKADRESNILIASDTIDIDESDCVPIGLSKGSTYLKTREALNLKTNTGIMRRKVKIKGSISKYMGVAGLKNAKDYRWTDN